MSTRPRFAYDVELDDIVHADIDTDDFTVETIVRHGNTANTYTFHGSTRDGRHVGHTTDATTRIVTTRPPVTPTT